MILVWLKRLSCSLTWREEEPLVFSMPNVSHNIRLRFRGSTTSMACGRMLLRRDEAMAVAK